MQTRIQISPEVIKRASAGAAAAANSDEINDYNDTTQPYLTLRQRGKSVVWMVRAYGKSKRLGSAIGQHVDPAYLGLREARERSKLIYAELAVGTPAEEKTPPPPAWTWADLDREYQTSLKEPRWSAGRVKPPSRGTQDDVRLAFAKPPVTALGPTALTALTSLEITRAVEKVHADNGHRAACKTLAYLKSALTWALSKRGEKSGLHGTMPWWSALRPPDPSRDDENRNRTHGDSTIQAGLLRCFARPSSEIVNRV